ALLDGAEGCGPAARAARLAQDDELADFLCGVQDEIIGEARRLLAQRTAVQAGAWVQGCTARYTRVQGVLGVRRRFLA
ncbi:MAG: hypothetical protein AVDCRST_MAG01-01-3894, partial [uncultured Rubrobacteraceae bacterium]